MSPLQYIVIVCAVGLLDRFEWRSDVKIKSERCVYIHVHTHTQVCNCMFACAVTMQVGVYLCMKMKLDMFEWSGSQALREVGLWFRGVSNVSLRRQMKRRAVQRGRERERACACAFQGVLFVQGCPNIYRALAALVCRGRAGAESSSRGKPLLSSTSADSFPLRQSVNIDSARDVCAW